MTKEVTMKKGRTSVWSDGEKVVIKNPVGFEHVQQNIDDLLGPGELAKMRDACYLETGLRKEYEMVTGYIPPVLKEKFKSPLDGLKNV
jgi:hypothetical protein